MNWLDWFIVAVLFISAWSGLRYGLLVSMARLAGVVAGLVVAFKYHRPLAGYLADRWGADQMLTPLAEWFLKFLLPAGKNGPGTAPPDDMTQAAAGILGPEYFNQFSIYLAEFFAEKILGIICFLLLLAVTASVINLAGHVLTKIAGICLLGPFNRLGGLLFGLGRGLLVVVILLMLVSPLRQAGLVPGAGPGAPGQPAFMDKSFEESRLLPYLDPILEAVYEQLPGLHTPGGGQKPPRLPPEESW